MSESSPPRPPSGLTKLFAQCPSCAGRGRQSHVSAACVTCQGLGMLAVYLASAVDAKLEQIANGVTANAEIIARIEPAAERVVRDNQYLRSEVARLSRALTDAHAAIRSIAAELRVKDCLHTENGDGQFRCFLDPAAPPCRICAVADRLDVFAGSGQP